MQVEIVLLLELERHVRHFEEREARAVVHLVETCSTCVSRPVLVAVISKRVDERQAEEVLVELPRLLGVAAAIGVVMKALDQVSDVLELLVFERPAKPYMTSLTFAQLGSFFMLPIQRWTFG